MPSILFLPMRSQIQYHMRNKARFHILINLSMSKILIFTNYFALKRRFVLRKSDVVSDIWAERYNTLPTYLDI